MTDDPLAPELSSSALITIDVQRDTLDMQPAEVPGTSAVLPAIGALVKRFRAHGLPVVHMVRLYLPDGSNVDLCRRQAVRAGASLFLAGSEGSQLAPGVLPEPATRLDHRNLLAGEPQAVGPAEMILFKPRWGAFFETSLRDILLDLDVSTLVFCGCNFPNCPRTSMYEASERDFKLVLAQNAISRLSEQGVDEMQAIGAAVWHTDRIAAELGRTPTAAAAR